MYRETFPGTGLRRLTTAYIVTVLVEQGDLPRSIWYPPVACISNFKGLSKLICTREVLVELAKEIFEQYGYNGEGFAKVFDRERSIYWRKYWKLTQKGRMSDNFELVDQFCRQDRKLRGRLHEVV